MKLADTKYGYCAEVLVRTFMEGPSFGFLTENVNFSSSETSVE